MMATKPGVWFRIPDFDRVNKATDENVPVDGEFIGSDKDIEAALFRDEGESILFANQHMFALSSSDIYSFYFSFAGIEVFALLSDDRLRVLKINFVKPHFFRLISDPTYDDIDTVGEDFWYFVYTRWRSISPRRMR